MEIIDRSIAILDIYVSVSSSYCAGQRLTPHYSTLEVRPGRITKKLELKYDYDCERDDTNSLLGVLMFGWDVVIANSDCLIEIKFMSVCLSVCLSTPTGCWCVGVWQLYDASKREVSTQTRLSMEPHAYRMVCW